VGENLAIDFTIPDEWAEFNISFSKSDAADDIQITGIEIHAVDSNPVGIHEAHGEASTRAEGVYNLSGARTNGLTRGLNIIRTNDGKTKKQFVR
jgi:hypothetical protein